MLGPRSLSLGVGEGVEGASQLSSHWEAEGTAVYRDSGH